MNKLQKGLIAGTLCLTAVFAGAAAYVPEHGATGRVIGIWASGNDEVAQLGMVEIYTAQGEAKIFNVENLKIQTPGIQEIRDMNGQQATVTCDESLLGYLWNTYGISFDRTWLSPASTASSFKLGPAAPAP